jgi:hypothetical protein
MIGHRDWGIFNRHFWGELIRRSQRADMHPTDLPPQPAGLRLCYGAWTLAKSRKNLRFLQVACALSMACSVVAIFGQIPRWRPTKGVDEKVDHYPLLGAEVSSHRVNGEDVDVRHVVSLQERQKRSLSKIPADHEGWQLDDALAGQSRRPRAMSSRSWRNSPRLWRKNSVAADTAASAGAVTWMRRTSRVHGHWALSLSGDRPRWCPG